MANVLNYTEQGGARTVIGGELVIEGTITLSEDAEAVGFPQAEDQEESHATTVADLKEDFNNLLVKLKMAGIMSSENTK